MVDARTLLEASAVVVRLVFSCPRQDASVEVRFRKTCFQDRFIGIIFFALKSKIVAGKQHVNAASMTNLFILLVNVTGIVFFIRNQM